ncbi:MAG: septum formation protein Maf [Nitrospinae bacterium]|nr:septum formation protein Maf [Nitrospinota bacterium]MBF0633569.1 septum formation protein Maf [Nitrospinota bacterium]
MIKNVILASSSPRRRELLAEAGVEFEIIAPHVDETADTTISPEENARIIAERKAEAISSTRRDKLIIAADTMVVLDGEMIGKPVDTADAIQMLTKLSGRKHKVVTGVAMAHVERGVLWSGVETSYTLFRPIPHETIVAYVKSGEPMDKAGAYAVQGQAAEWIEGFEGSVSNIIGLPMELLTRALRDLGYLLEEEPSQCR